MKLFVILSLFKLMECYRILLVANIPVSSHYFLMNSLAKGLVNAGHNCTIISAFSEKNPPTKNGTYREIVVSKSLSTVKGMKTFFLDLERTNPFNMVKIVSNFGTIFTRLTLEDPKVQRLLASPEERFDVVVVQQFYNDALRALSHHYNAPLVSYSTIAISIFINPTVANPSPPSYIPEMFLQYGKNMNFWQKVKNFLFRNYHELYIHLRYLPEQERLMRKFFPESPSLDRLYYNSSVALVNSHESICRAVPTVPAVVQVAGLHVEPTKKLPDELQRYLDEAAEGAIYFSMGTNLKPSEFKNETVRALVEVFRKVPMKVLWKWDEETLPDRPENVRISKWYPQNDVLAHPNVKLFITHGGFLSLTETVHHGVPILAFPIFGDQKLNAQRAVDAGIGLKIGYEEITEEKLTEAMFEILFNPKYRQTVKMKQSLLHDRPVKPLDLAIYWVEYVARYGGAEHLKVDGLNLRWFQYLSLDVVAFLVAVIWFILYIIYVASKACYVKLVGTRKVKLN